MALSKPILNACNEEKHDAISDNLLDTATILASLKNPSMAPNPDLVAEVREKLVKAISGGALDDDLHALIEGALSPAKVAVTSTVIANLATRATDLVISTTNPHTNDNMNNAHKRPLTWEGKKHPRNSKKRKKEEEEEESDADDDPQVQQLLTKIPPPVNRSLETFADPTLAKSLLDWAFNNELGCTDMSKNWKTHPGFSRMCVQSKNERVNYTVALLCVHQYALGCIGSLPRSANRGRLIDLLVNPDEEDKEIFQRGLEMAEYMEQNCEISFVTLSRNNLLMGNLYNKTDHIGRQIKMYGVFDPNSDRCCHTVNCKGLYLKQYLKLNQVFNGLHTKLLSAKQYYISKEDEALVLANTNRLHFTEEECRINARKGP
jgi:hypothetical protein